jgi:hypothetical protein
MSRNKNCCLCGAERHPSQKPSESLSNDVRMITMKEHRELKPGRWEDSPQMLVSVCIWRNGGTAPGATHICDECLVVGLEEVERFVQYQLATKRAAAAALKALQTGAEVSRG